MRTLDPRCWCGHTRSSHVATSPTTMGCASCAELGENNVHYFKLDPAQGENVLKAVAEESKPVDPNDFAADFKVSPLREELNVMPQNGDEFRVFIVTTGAYSDYAIQQIFVGNREAAYTWAAEYNRHRRGVHYQATVEEWTDECKGAPSRREYDDPYTLIRIETHVHMGDGRVINTNVYDSVEFRMVSTNTVVSDGGWSRLGHATAKTAVITTRGPDHDRTRILKSHSEHVARVRQAAIENTPTEVTK